MKFKETLKTFLSGIGMGVGAAIPGVSGGTIAVLTGIYEKLINAVNGLFKNFVKSLLTLLPILIGMIVAIVPCVFLFDKAFEGFVFGLVSLFAGLTIGSFPGVTKEVKGVKVKTSYIVVAIISGVIALSLGVLSILTDGIFNMTTQVAAPQWWFFILVIFFGLLASTALIVPGISGSMLMLLLGFYNPLLDCIKNLLTFKGDQILSNLGIIGCFVIGVVVGFFLISKLMGHLLDKHHNITYFSIIGFIIGSTIALFLNTEIFNYYLVWGGQTIEGISPFLAWYIEVPIAIVLFVLGIVGSYLLVKFSNKK